jgi:hypothetical protein
MSRSLNLLVRTPEKGLAENRVVDVRFSLGMTDGSESFGASSVPGSGCTGLSTSLTSLGISE